MKPPTARAKPARGHLWREYAAVSPSAHASSKTAHAPSRGSWWVGCDRPEFGRRLAEVEQARIASTSTGGTTPTAKNAARPEGRRRQHSRHDPI
jgi:hypothetical protein